MKNIPAGLEDFDARILQRVLQILVRAAHEVVVDDNLRDVFLCQSIDRVRADKTRPPDHDDTFALDVHVFASFARV